MPVGLVTGKRDLDCAARYLETGLEGCGGVYTEKLGGRGRFFFVASLLRNGRVRNSGFSLDSSLDTYDGSQLVFRLSFWFILLSDYIWLLTFFNKRQHFLFHTTKFSRAKE